MQSKRRHKRFTLNVLEVNGKMMFATEVRVIDISIGGISLKANRRLNIGSEYALKLDGKDRAISLKGAVIWSSLSAAKNGPDGEVAPIYTAGLKFTNMSTARITELLNFIEGHKKEEVPVTWGDRLSVRFHINDEEKAVLNLPSNCTVREISLGGMLIECEQDLEIESAIPMTLSTYDDKLIDFIGRVASCRVIYGDGRKQYAVGIEFLDLTDKDREILATFIDCCTAIEKNGKEESSESLPVISKELIDKVEHLYKWHKTMGYYKVLCVKEWAPDEQIERAFLRMAQEFHPDKHPDISQDLKEKIEVIFAYMNEAYSTLMSPQKKKEYDRSPVPRIRH
jgi:c-di-GMP-binding flagellar brake protein YcgR